MSIAKTYELKRIFGNLLFFKFLFYQTVRGGFFTKNKNRLLFYKTHEDVLTINSGIKQALIFEEL
jgi:hypothetical protein